MKNVKEEEEAEIKKWEANRKIERVERMKRKDGEKRRKLRGAM